MKTTGRFHRLWTLSSLNQLLTGVSLFVACIALWSNCSLAAEDEEECLEGDDRCAKYEQSREKGKEEECLEGDDRCAKYEQSREKGKEETDRTVKTSKEQHEMQRQEHEKKAEEAEQREDYKTAEKERKEAMIEQMKVQKLEEQIQKNYESSSKNEESRELVRKQNEDKEKQKGLNSSVIKVRENSTKPSAESQQAMEEAASSTSSMATAEVANLSDFEPVSASNSPPDQVGKSTSSDSAPAKPGNLLTDLENLEKSDRLSISYQDSVSKEGGAQQGSSESSNSTQASQAQMRLISSATNSSAGSFLNKGETNIWETGDQGKRESPSRNLASHSSNTGTTTQMAGAMLIQGAESKNSLDQKFFDQCPYRDGQELSDESVQKEQVSPKCKKFIARCSDELDQMTEWSEKSKKTGPTKIGRNEKPKLSDDCKKWHEYYETKKEKGLKHVEKIKTGSTPNNMY